MAEIKNIGKFKMYLERAKLLINKELYYVDHLIEEAGNDVDPCFPCFIDDDDITLVIVELLAREDNETLV